MRRHNAYIVSNTATLFRLQMDIVAVRSIKLALGKAHRLRILWLCNFLLDLAIDKFDADIFRCHAVHADPCMYVDALSKAELSLASPINIQFQPLPALSDALFPLS